MYEPTDGVRVVFAIFFTMILSALAKQLQRKSGIPFTSTLLAVGLVLGIFEDNLGFLGECVRYKNRIDPHTLLMIFIPGLAFEAAYNTNAYMFTRSKWQMIILAGPGVIIGSYGVAFILRYIFQYKELDTTHGVMIGSIISTTDPVAVIALLKELKSSTRFRIMIEGESLLNDGTAFVFFLVCLEIIKSGELVWGSAIKEFLRISFGGALLGLVFGMVVSLVINQFRRNSILISVIILTSCYGSFFIAEVLLDVSGHLALVVFGVYLASNLRVHLNKEMDHTIHSVFTFLGYILESMMFMLTGTFIGERFSKFHEHMIETSDIWKIILFHPL